MKKSLLLLAVAAISASCTLGDLEIDSRSADDLFNFTSLMVTKSIEGPVEVICNSQEEGIFSNGYQDTLWSRQASLDLVLKKAPEDSLWMIFPCDSDEGYNFYTFVRMLPSGLGGHNDFIVDTKGTYTEKEYRSDFRTNGDFYLRWEEEQYFGNGLYFSIRAIPYGKFEAETYLEYDPLDWCKVEYQGQEFSYRTSKGDILSLEH